jgi:hypothetical protein
MGRTNRTAPDPEWVLWYRNGISATRIAAAAGIAESTVRRHVGIAARQDPGLRAARRLPSRRTDRERALATWLQRRRRRQSKAPSPPPTPSPWTRSTAGVSSQRDALPMRHGGWTQRLAEVAAYLAAGNDWPRHHRTEG